MPNPEHVKIARELEERLNESIERMIANTHKSVNYKHALRAVRERGMKAIPLPAPTDEIDEDGEEIDTP